jgi:hypothetical protein
LKSAESSKKPQAYCHRSGPKSSDAFPHSRQRFEFGNGSSTHGRDDAVGDLVLSAVLVIANRDFKESSKSLNAQRFDRFGIREIGS